MNNKEINPSSMFYLSEEDRKRLKLNNKLSVDENIEYIFTMAKIQEGKSELTLEEITIAYYKLITKPEEEANPGKNFHVKTKKDIAQKLFMMRQETDDHKPRIELCSRGKYRLKQSD